MGSVLFNSPKDLAAFFVIQLMCSAKVKESLKVIPRYLNDVTLLRGEPSTVYAVGKLALTLVEENEHLSG